MLVFVVDLVGSGFQESTTLTSEIEQISAFGIILMGLHVILQTLTGTLHVLPSTETTLGHIFKPANCGLLWLSVIAVVTVLSLFLTIPESVNIWLGCIVIAFLFVAFTDIMLHFMAFNAIL